MTNRIVLAIALIVAWCGGAIAAEVDDAKAAAAAAGCGSPQYTGEGQSSGGGHYYTFACSDGAVAWVDCVGGRCTVKLL